jgi:DeoR/GlpR family transcriptional regulator of sugar metabolism
MSVYARWRGEVPDFDHNGSGTHVVPAQRRERIATRLAEAGSVTVQELEEAFGVSPMTARRDLQALAREGRAQRTYGGAVAPGAVPHEDSFQVRLDQAADAKQRLGRAALAHVEDGEAVFVDCSTTAYVALRELLAAGRRMTVLTNSVPVMDLVAQSDLATTELIGLAGSLRRTTRSFVGPLTVAAIERHYADKLLFSVNGVAPGGILTDADPLEAEVKRAMVAQSREAVLLVDGSKLDRASLSTITHVSAMSAVLVADADAAQLEPLRRAGIRTEAVA